MPVDGCAGATITSPAGGQEQLFLDGLHRVMTNERPPRGAVKGSPR